MFDAQKETKKIINFIREYFSNQQLGGVIIGISGGKDSAVVAALFVKALGPEKVIGVTMPCHSKEIDRKDAQLISEKYHFSLINIDLTTTFDTLKSNIQSLTDFVESEDSDINAKPRLRMTTLYYLAQMYSRKEKQTYIVAGTGNKCEEYVGYFTKGGDSVSDIKVLADLTVSEVIKIGEVLEVPSQVLYKTPNDGLSGKSDEEKLGVTYENIAKVIQKQEIDQNTKEKIEQLHKRAHHKFEIATYRKEIKK